MTADSVTIRHVDRLDLIVVAEQWAYERDNRAAIDAHFKVAQRANPSLWNGKVLLMCRHRIEAGTFHGEFLQADFASFLAWRLQGRPSAGIGDCFGSAAVVSADGALLLGKMAPHTSNAGQIYFPCGMPDASDVKEGRLDFDNSIARELKEETGIDTAGMQAETGWTLVEAGRMFALVKTLHSAETAQALKSRATTHLRAEKNPELSEIHMFSNMGDVTPSVPTHVRAFLAHFWR